MTKAILLQATGSSRTFAHPDDITRTVTQKVKLSEKVVDGKRTPHLRTEIILGRQAPIKVCENSCAGYENLSVRLSISGSIKNHEALDGMLDELKSIIDRAKADKVSKGFPLTETAFTE